jgi:colicin import membrane protein
VKKDEARQAAIREANLRRMLKEAGTSDDPAAAGTAARTSGPSSGYAGRIKARVKPNIVLTATIAGNPLAVVEVKVAPDGTIVGRRLVTKSGSAAWDETVLRAVDKTEVLPKDTDGRVPPTILIEFRPND